MLGNCSYVQVLLPLRLEWEPWYRTEREVKRGTRVLVEFCHKTYTGVVSRVCARPGIEESQIQDVISFPELDPITEEELRLWQFTAGYYLCTIGEVFKAARGGREAKRKGKAPAEAIPKAKAQVPPKPVLLISDRQFRLDRYVQAIRETLREGHTALVLVPEIALASNTEARLLEEFPEELRVHHSSKTIAERRKVTEFLSDPSKPGVILGTRVSLFLPYRNLGLVIVDEEQDPNYKQNDPAPRYNARDLAIVLASIHKAGAILGSPCPSLESLYNAWSGKFSLDSSHAPRVTAEIIDIVAERRKHGMDGRFSYKLISEIQKTDGPIAIVRGWEPQEELRQSIDQLFPGKDIELLTPYEAQTRPKAYDLAAFIQADSIFPREDFRSDEKAIQSITRIAVCAKKTVVQTVKSEHPVYKALSSGEGIHEALMAERKAFSLPPYSKLISVKDSNILRLGATIRKLGLNTSITKPNPSQILVSIGRDSNFNSEKQRVAAAISDADAEFQRSGHPTVDVDPL